MSFCSNCDRDNAEVYEMSGYFEAVDEVFLSCRLGLAKPDEKFFRLMLEGLAAQPWECVFLDDMKKNIDTARSMGMHTILVPRQATSRGRKAEYFAEQLARHAVRGV